MAQTIPAQRFASVILTRPFAASTSYCEANARLFSRAKVIFSPLLDIVSTNVATNLSGYNGVIFTSTNGVLYGGVAGPCPAYCVGHATTQLAGEKGWAAKYVGATSSDLINTLRSAAPEVPLLHIGGRHRRGDVAKSLTRFGIPTDEVDVYDQVLLPLSAEAHSALSGEQPVIVPLFSPRTARQFAKNAQISAPVHFVAISEAVLAEVADLPYVSKHVSAAPNAKSVSAKLQNVLRRVEADGTAQ